jgi:hypothetical protein
MEDDLIDRPATGAHGKLEAAQEYFKDRPLDLAPLEDGPAEPVVAKRRLVENQRAA